MATPMMLFLLTTDGGDQEDGNVYYARHLLVDAPWELREALHGDIANILGCGPELVFKRGDAVRDRLWESEDALPLRLRERGWAARYVSTDFIVQEEDWPG